MWKLILISGLVAFGTACAQSETSESIEGPWQMTSGVVDGEDIPILDSHPISITFEGNQVSGTAACNGYGGTYELDGSSIRFSDLAMTEMGCFPEEIMEAEAMFASAISRVDTVSVDGTLTLAGDDVEMVFQKLEPVPEAELTDTVWVLDGLMRGDAVSSPIQGSRATLEFFTDGSINGDTGCRQFSGEYTISGAEVVITNLAADGHECEPDMAEQDSQFLSVLEGTLRIEIEGNRLSITVSGDEGLTFIAEP